MPSVKPVTMGDAPDVAAKVKSPRRRFGAIKATSKGVDVVVVVVVAATDVAASIRSSKGGGGESMTAETIGEGVGRRGKRLSHAATVVDSVI